MSTKKTIIEHTWRVLAAAALASGCGGAATESYQTSSVGLFPAADCDSWSLSGGLWTGPANAVGVAILQRSDGAGGWVDACESIDYLEIGAREGDDMFSTANPHEFSGSFSCTIPAGQYRVSLTATYYSIYDGSTPVAVLSRLAPAEGEALLACGATSAWANRTPGYWKNHEEVWPVSELTLGDTTYSKACLLAFFDVPTRGDIRVKLIHHLVAAKLNLLMGSDGSALGSTVTDADAYLSASGTEIGCGTMRLSGSGRDRRTANELKDVLDAFNNNLL